MLKITRFLKVLSNNIFNLKSGKNWFTKRLTTYFSTYVRNLIEIGFKKMIFTRVYTKNYGSNDYYYKNWLIYFCNIYNTYFDLRIENVQL